MISSKFKQIIPSRTTLYDNIRFRCFITNSRIILKKWVSIDNLLTKLTRKEHIVMSPLRVILMDFRVWSAWTRSNLVSTVVKRYKKDCGVREVIHRFRQTFFRPKRILLISATAAFKTRDEDDDNNQPCDKSITNAELEELLKDLDAVEMLSRNTLFCAFCSKRLIIDKKQPGVQYCSCKIAEVTKESNSVKADGWVPYMEAEDVIIWRKEYKAGLGLYAYKVYGRYPEVRAEDFAAVQMDSTYRRKWDTAVASLSIVEQHANGLVDQTVLHWEVLWPRLFANRDYVYIRRHKEFKTTDKGLAHREGLFQPVASIEQAPEPVYQERPNVHSNAKRKAMEWHAINKDADSFDNKIYVIVNRSCEHPDVPESRHAIRVYEYWSHMVVKTMDGADKSGMEFVLTYYDEPAVGGLPGGVAAWATGRAAPAYLHRMRHAARHYRAWTRAQQETPDFTPFVVETPTSTELEQEKKPTRVEPVSEQDMELTRLGPEPESNGESVEPVGPVTRDQGTQTEKPVDKVTQVNEEIIGKVTKDKSIETEPVKHEPLNADGDTSKTVDEDETKANG